MSTRLALPKHVLTASATAADTRSRQIQPGVREVEVIGVTTDANDWITLPSLAQVPNGTAIRILCNAGANFELRTPAGSNEETNSEDSDGTKEYLCTDTQLVIATKVNNTIGWEVHGYTQIGAVATAVVPD